MACDHDAVAPEICPDRHDAVIFDTDGVITDTASVHSEAWRWMFDELFGQLDDDGRADLSPFTDDDYDAHIDGKPRLDGIADLLAARRIDLPVGSPSDPAGTLTHQGLATRKNDAFLQRLDADGVRTFDETVALVRRLQAAGIATGVFSSSRNCEQVLARAGLAELFDERVDGVVAAELGLPGKPDPAVLVETARRVGAEPARTVVVEDAPAGVEAGRRGGFALVIGIDRRGDGHQLIGRGADVVVGDLGAVTVVGGGPT